MPCYAHVSRLRRECDANTYGLGRHLCEGSEGVANQLKLRTDIGGRWRRRSCSGASARARSSRIGGEARQSRSHRGGGSLDLPVEGDGLLHSSSDCESLAYRMRSEKGSTYFARLVSSRGHWP